MTCYNVQVYLYFCQTQTYLPPQIYCMLVKDGYRCTAKPQRREAGPTEAVHHVKDAHRMRISQSLVLITVSRISSTYSCSSSSSRHGLASSILGAPILPTCRLATIVYVSASFLPYRTSLYRPRGRLVVIICCDLADSEIRSTIFRAL